MEPEQPKIPLELIKSQSEHRSGSSQRSYQVFESSRPSKSLSVEEQGKTQNYYNKIGKYSMPQQEENQFMAKLAEASICRHHTPENNYNHSMYFQILSSKEQGKYLMLQVFVASFELVISVLNTNDDRHIPHHNIGTGSYGTVFIASDGNGHYAKKFLQLQGQGYIYTFRKVLQEYCILKIAGLLGIAPRVRHGKGFDLVLYNNGIEFAMELCKPYYYFSGTDFTQSFTEMLCKLHWLHIIHKDIKPENLFCSFDESRLLFGDFGISNIVYEQPEQLSKTFYGGTKYYMGSDMPMIKKQGSGWLNLYYHDKECSDKTISEINARRLNRGNYKLETVSLDEVQFEKELSGEFQKSKSHFQEAQPRHNEIFIRRVLGTSFELLRYIDSFDISERQKVDIKQQVDETVEKGQEGAQSIFLKRALGLTDQFVAQLSVYLRKRVKSVDTGQFAHLVNMTTTLFHSCLKSRCHLHYCRQAIQHLKYLEGHYGQYRNTYQKEKQAINNLERELEVLRQGLLDLRSGTPLDQKQIDIKQRQYRNIEQIIQKKQSIYKNYQEMDFSKIRQLFQDLLSLGSGHVEVETLKGRYKKDEPEVLTLIGLLLNQRKLVKQALSVLQQVDPTKLYEEPLDIVVRAMDRVYGPQKALKFLEDARERFEMKPDKIQYCSSLMLIEQLRIEILASFEPQEALIEAQRMQNKYGKGLTNQYEKAMFQLYKFQYKPKVLKCKAIAYRQSNLPQAIRAIEEAETLIAQLFPFKKSMMVVPYKKVKANTYISFGRTRSHIEMGIQVLSQLIQHQQKHSKGFADNSTNVLHVGELHHIIATGYMKLREVNKAHDHLTIAEGLLSDSDLLFQVGYDRLRWFWRDMKDEAQDRLEFLERWNQARPVLQRTQKLFDLRMVITGVPWMIEKTPIQQGQCSQLQRNEKRLQNRKLSQEDRKEVIEDLKRIFKLKRFQPTRPNIELEIECCRILIAHYTQRINSEKSAEKNAFTWLTNIRSRLDRYHIDAAATMDGLAVNLLKQKCHSLAQLCIYRELSDAFRAAQYIQAFLRMQNIATRSGVFTENETYSSFLNFTMKMIEFGNPRNPPIEPSHYLFRPKKKQSRSINLIRQVHRFHVALNKSHPPKQTANNLKIIELKNMLQFIVDNRIYAITSVPLRTLLTTLKQLRLQKPKLTATTNSALITSKRNIRDKAFSIRYNKLVHPITN